MISQKVKRQSQMQEAKESKELICLSAARAEIAKARSINECNQISNKADALRHYAKKVGMSLDAQNDLAEIVIETQARAGEILKAMAESGERRLGDAGRPKKGSCAEPFLETLSDLGVTKKQSHIYQRVAAVTEESRARYMADNRETKTLATTTGLLKSIKRKEASTEPEEDDDEDDAPIPQPDEPDFAPDDECVFAIQDILTKCWGKLTIEQKRSVGIYFKTQAMRMMREVEKQ